MKTLNIETFRGMRNAFDRTVASTPDADPFCSSSYWILPAFDALFPGHDGWIRRAQDTEGFVTLARGFHPRIGNYFQPMEASWGLANPLIGPEPRALVDEFAREVTADEYDWDMLFLSGLFKDSRQFRAAIRAFQHDYTVGVGPSMGRNVASLEEGFEAWFERRSSKFRSNIRRARRRAREAGVETEYLDDVDLEATDEVFERILAIEEQSWKGRENSGIATGRMRDFYARMLPPLVRNDAFRATFLRLDDTDIAYCFGGVFEGRYRGLQLSYHDDYGEHSPGNLAQVVMIEGLCEEGISTYDMGQSMEYKERWSDRVETSKALIVRR